MKDMYPWIHGSISFILNHILYYEMKITAIPWIGMSPSMVGEYGCILYTQQRVTADLTLTAPLRIKGDQS